MRKRIKGKDTHNEDKDDFMPIEGLNRYGLVCTPILSAGDLSGAVIFLNNYNHRLSKF